MTVITAKGGTEPLPPGSEGTQSDSAKQAPGATRLTVPIVKDEKGFYQPASEEELIALVKKANSEGKQLRVRGAVHSVAAAIYTDPLVARDYAVDQESPPPTDAINVMLNNYRGLRVLDAGQRLVEVDAGLNLGVDPMDPTHTSTLENSLLYMLWTKGWTLSDLGGITHQTISGFISTGSSGGSLTFSVYDNVQRLRMIDGRGEVYEVDRDQSPEDFHATVTSMGLLGVISKVVLKCDPTFNITGQEAITTMEEASVDLFGDGSTGRPSLEQFLKQVEYTRLEWWPQRKGERLVTWQAQRIPPQPGFRPTRYEEFGNDFEMSEVFISIFYTILGNLDDLRAAKPKLEATFQQVDADLIEDFRNLGAVGHILAKALTLALKGGVDAAIDVLQLGAPELKAELPNLMKLALDKFMPLDSTKKDMEKGEPQAFRDWAWQGLPMDNQASDVLVPTEFTEIWIPIQYSQRVMTLLKDYFAEPTSDQEALKRTGTYAIEIYGARPNPFWMSMSYSDGKDEWSRGVVRIDFYWFADNAGNPAEIFYPQFWNLFRDNGIPFRLHWGKFQPMGDANELARWASFFRGQYARWDDFLARRQVLDPDNVFLTTYWRQRLGLLHLPAPQPREDGAKNAPRIDPVPPPPRVAPVTRSSPEPVPQPPHLPGWELSGVVSFYCWLTLAVVLYGVSVAHIPFLIGTPWTTCEGQGSPLGCVLAFHLFEVPLVSFNAFIAWYGLKRFSLQTVSRFRSLLTFAVSVNLVFFAFEIILLLGGLQRQQPLWETLALFSVAFALGGGAFLGMYVHQKLLGVPRRDSK